MAEGNGYCEMTQINMDRALREGGENTQIKNLITEGAK